MKPKRIQRKRTKGWQMPPNCVYVGRPTKWGNPFTGKDAVEKYRDWLLSWINSGDAGFLIDLNKLRGKDLACWCKLSDKCQADILLEIANKGM